MEEIRVSHIFKIYTGLIYRLFLDEIKRESSKKGKKHDMKHEPKVEKNPITNYFKSSKLSA